MTTERALEFLHRLQDEQFDGIHGDERREALEMAVRALSGDGDTIYRQDAIDMLRNLANDDWNKSTSTSWANAFETCADILCDLPSAQPTQTNTDSTHENTLDCVSRQEAIDEVAKWFYDVFGIKESDGTATIFKRLRELPSAQPRKTGKWIILPPIFEEICQCSKCKMKFKDALQWTNYCPNCGADMRGESDE